MDLGEALQIITALRENKELNQEDVARFFGFKRSGRLTIGRWEGGAKPPAKHRARFLQYLIEELGLRENPDRLNEIWDVLSNNWRWSPITEPEKQKYGIVDGTNKTDWDLLTNSDLLTRLKSSDPGISSKAIRKIGKRVTQGIMPVDALSEASSHSYWLIRRLAIEYILKLNLPSTLNLLYSFRKTSYHVSQQLIRDYIESEFLAERLEDEKYNMAIDILESLSKAPKVTSLSRKKDLSLLKKLQDGKPRSETTGTTR